MEEKSRHAFHIYYFVGITVLILVFAVEVIASAYIDVHDLVLSLTALALGATLAAYLTTATYDHISRSTQEREWKREIQMTTWRTIYLPIYQRLVSDLYPLERYGNVGYELWDSRDFSEKETLLEVVNPRFLGKVKNHLSLHDEYLKAHREFDNDVQGLCDAYHQNLFPGDPVDPLNSMLYTNRLFLAGRATLIPENDKKSYASAYNTLKKNHPDLAEDPSTTIDILKDKVQASPKTHIFLHIHSLYLESTKDLLEATKEVIQKPYQL